MDRAGLEWTRLSKRSQAAIRNSSSSCVKDKISKRRQTILEIEKKSRKKTRAEGFPIPFLTWGGSFIPYFSFPFQRERKKLPS
jgi:hypothetical protein